MSEQFEVNYGNRLMAEALGIKLEHSKLLDEEGYSIPGHWVYDDMEGKPTVLFRQQLRFHKDWNWLHRVVDHITTLNRFVDEYPDNSVFWDAWCGGDMDTVWDECVEYLEWEKKSYKENSENI